MTPPAEVSGREAEVLAAVGAHLSNAQIASTLHISVRTVEGHVSSLLRKYGVGDRRELAALAATGPAGASPPGGVAGLPAARTTFIGRDRDRETVLAALADGRLVSLVGPGGVGKTRLAALVAETAAAAFAFGGAFVDLVPVGRDFVVQAVAAALGVAERPQQPLVEAVLERLGRGRSLLVLDNCEHLLDPVADVIERVLATCPRTAILATSRERLAVPGEHVVAIGPLPLGSDAERLFVDRARTADPGYDADPQAVTDVCARLDGLPLAIELAAARGGSLGTAGLLTALGDYLRLLSGGRGRAVRHRSLHAVIGWSYDLLDDEERALFGRLAVFAGSFDITAAAAVTGAGDPAAVADVLGRLVDKNLVQHERGTGRWRLLATIRAFGADQLDRDDGRNETARRHLAWATDTAAGLADDRREGWQDTFDAVADDLRSALAGCPAGPDPTAHRLARALARLTFARRFLHESVDRYRTAAGHAATPDQAARDLLHAADCAHAAAFSGYPAFDLLRTAADRARAAGDRATEATALARAVEMAGRFPVGFPAEVPHDELRRLLDRALTASEPHGGVVAARLACAAAWTAHPDTGTPDPALANTALAAARATGDPVLVSAALDAVAAAAARAGRLRDAHRYSNERFTLLAVMDRDDPYAAPEIVDAYSAAFSDALEAGDLPAAMAVARRFAGDDLVGGPSYLAASLLIPVQVLTGDLTGALRHAATMWADWELAGRPSEWRMRSAAAAITLAHGLIGNREEHATWRARLAGVALCNGTRGTRLVSTMAFIDARTAVQAHTFDGADALIAGAFADHPRGRYEAYAQAAAAELAVAAGLPDAADRLAQAAPAADENDWAAACLARATGRLYRDEQLLTTAIDAWNRIGARLESALTQLLLPARAGHGRAVMASLGLPPQPNRPHHQADSR